MQVSEAESAVMEVLWRSHPLGAEQVVAALATNRQWQGATIKTLLNRLLRKGAIGAEKQGRRFLYSPLLRREDWEREQGLALVERVFGGRVAPLVAHLTRHRKLTRRDIAELRKLLDELEDGER